jgi:hypothetical protein
MRHILMTTALAGMLAGLPAFATTDTTAGSAAAVTAPEGYQASDIATLTFEELQGATVYDAKGKRVGEISDFVLAMDASGGTTDETTDETTGSTRGSRDPLGRRHPACPISRGPSRNTGPCRSRLAKLNFRALRVLLVNGLEPPEPAEQSNVPARHRSELHRGPVSAAGRTFARGRRNPAPRWRFGEPCRMQRQEPRRSAARVNRRKPVWIDVQVGTGTSTDAS